MQLRMPVHPTPPLPWARLGIALLALLVGVPSGASALEVGEAAPAFSLPGSDGKTHTSAEHRGQRGIVLAWFPKAFTPG